MKSVLSCIVLLLWAATALADPQDAVVRIPSHGCSGVVISTQSGSSRILSCAHAFENGLWRKPLVLDIPSPSPDRTSRSLSSRCLAINYALDLSVWDIGVGPLAYVAPVAPEHHRVNRDLYSAGYDSMRPVLVHERAFLLSTNGAITYVRGQPWPGRSGGPLLDGDFTVGIVQGYELDGERRGRYASHSALLQFLGMARGAAGGELTRGQARERTQPPSLCPDGRCPWR